MMPHSVEISDLVRMPHHANQVRQLILQNNFFVVRSRVVALSRKRVEQFYNEHEGKFFYNRWQRKLLKELKYIKILGNLF